MGEERKNEVQDPADQYRTDRRVEVEPQPEPATKTVVEHVPTEEPHTLEVRETETVVKEEPAKDDES